MTIKFTAEQFGWCLYHLSRRKSQLDTIVKTNPKQARTAEYRLVQSLFKKFLSRTAILEEDYKLLLKPGNGVFIDDDVSMVLDRRETGWLRGVAAVILDNLETSTIPTYEDRMKERPDLYEKYLQRSLKIATIVKDMTEILHD